MISVYNVRITRPSLNYPTICLNYPTMSELPDQGLNYPTKIILIIVMIMIIIIVVEVKMIMVLIIIISL